MGHKRHGSVTPTATGSSWCSGHPVTPMGSPLPTLARRPVPSARLGSGYRSENSEGLVAFGHRLARELSSGGSARSSVAGEKAIMGRGRPPAEVQIPLYQGRGAGPDSG